MTFSKSGTGIPMWNWARTHQFTASNLASPTSIAGVQSVLDGSELRGESVRCIGSRHSFTDIADGTTLLDLSRLPERFEISDDRSSVTVGAAMTYARLAELLQEPQLALANMASLPHISIAGAVATATHGSGNRNGNLATAVRSLQVVTSGGEVSEVQRGEADFDGCVVSLGALGAVTAIELDVQPTYDVAQQVHEGVSWGTFVDGFGKIFASAYSVSGFTDWVEPPNLWTKRRLDQAEPDHASLHDGSPAKRAHHPVPTEQPDACTEQFDRAGIWSNRLPHFRASHKPSMGAEVQSEFFVAQADSGSVIEAMRSIGTELADVLMVGEIRTVASDQLWLSPTFDRNSLALHFTWHHDVAAATSAAHLVATTLAPFAPRPHWGKVFSPRAHDFVALYPRLADARRVFTEWDPAGVFQNSWTRRNIL